MKVLVCGMPFSGNRLVVQRLRACGLDVTMDHGATPSMFEEAGALVVVYRLDEDARLRSKERHDATRAWPSKKEREGRRVVGDAMKRIPWYSVCYEDILRTGGQVLDEIVKLLGGTPKPWPEFDPQQPYRGRVYQNESERAEAHEAHKNRPVFKITPDTVQGRMSVL